MCGRPWYVMRHLSAVGEAAPCSPAVGEVSPCSPTIGEAGLCSPAVGEAAPAESNPTQIYNTVFLFYIYGLLSLTRVSVFLPHERDH